MKRFTSLLNRRSSSADSGSSSADTPEANVARGVRLFCESGAPNNSGDEVLHLPLIVESAESSPAAAREAANVIRKFLSKENSSRGYVQYNAIMLMRILADNPGKTFTRNFDGKFVSTTKDLLKDGRDVSVQQILRETLDTFEVQKADDETLKPLIAMWRAEKTKPQRNGTGPVPRTFNVPPFNPADPNSQQQFYSRGHSHRQRGLPEPHELASRIEEAKTSSKLLLQVVATTPPGEIFGNELITEFADRCQAASRSIQGYISCDNPPPDDDTLVTLIETNDQISLALSKHQRAILQARRHMDTMNASNPSVVQPPAGPPPGQAAQPPVVPPRGPPPKQGFFQRIGGNRGENREDPFADSQTQGYSGQPQGLQAPLQPQSNGLLSATSGPMPNNYPPMEEPDPSQSQTQSNPYHPGYKATHSYLQRQESSGNNLTMHGSMGAMGEEEEPSSPEESRVPVQYRF
ncbi:MAG: hypothetical protein MMC33_003337 [Icmadophila ericetorum]|nr:hypothetical protein [Icmadophila ericetorum]